MNFGESARLIVRGPQRDHLGQRLGVARHAPERVAAVGPHRPAEARSDRVDHHQVGELQPGLRIVVQLRRALASGAEFGEARAGQPEMQIGRRRARPAVEHERHRPFDRRRLVRDIGDVEHRRDPFARLVVQRQRARGRGVADRSAVGRDLVARHGARRQQPQRALVGDLAELDEWHRRMRLGSLPGCARRRSAAIAIVTAASSKAARARGSAGHGGKRMAGKCIAGDPASSVSPPRRASLADPGRPFKQRAASRSCEVRRVRTYGPTMKRRRRRRNDVRGAQEKTHQCRARPGDAGPGRFRRRSRDRAA